MISYVAVTVDSIEKIDPGIFFAYSDEVNSAERSTVSIFERRPAQMTVGHFEPLPVPEVSETDWADWEDSVAFQDSQFPDNQSTENMPLTAEVVRDIDAFASVTKRGK